MSNTFGEIFKITTFGESHGEAIGVTIDGCPSGLDLDLGFIQEKLNKRRPNINISGSTLRKEQDKVKVISGLYDGKTIGSPITFIIENQDFNSNAYEDYKFRPNHADLTYHRKYGIDPMPGGGRASARETATRVASGAVAELILLNYGIKIIGWVTSIGDINLNLELSDINKFDIDLSKTRCPSKEYSKVFEEKIKSAQKEKDSLGGEVICVATGVPAGLGSPVFGKLEAKLAAAMLSIPASKTFQIGYESVNDKKGSEVMDEILPDGFTSNHSGGIQGGISNGSDIVLKVGFKPVASIPQEFKTITIEGKETKIKTTGRHDSCIVPRAVPVVESMMSLVLVDEYLKSNKR